jgi:hypothetical protein
MNFNGRITAALATLGTHSSPWAPWQPRDVNNAVRQGDSGDAAVGLFGVELDFNNVVAIVSVAIPVPAFFWEFVVIRRKRLGYRLQMDTLATDTARVRQPPLLGDALPAGVPADVNGGLRYRRRDGEMNAAAPEGTSWVSRAIRSSTSI